MELAAGAKLGSGDAAVRLDEHKRAAKKIRLGLERRASEKGAQALEEVRVSYLIAVLILKYATFFRRRTWVTITIALSTSSMLRPRANWTDEKGTKD